MKTALVWLVIVVIVAWLGNIALTGYEKRECERWYADYEETYQPSQFASWQVEQCLHYGIEL